MSSNDLITVGIPIYNVQQYLSECLDSIVRQTYSNLEIILIDDGSTDQSGDIADKYALKDKRIRVVHNPNKGRAVSRNNAAALATGKFIVFVDSDDSESEDYISHLYELILKHKACMASVGMLKFINITEINTERVKESITIYEADEVIKHSVNIPNRTWGKIYKTEIIKDNLTFVNPFNDTGEDNILAVDLLKVYKKIVLSDLPLYYWRYTTTGITSTSSKSIPYTMLFLGNRFVGNREFIEWCIKHKPQLTIFAKVRLAYALCGEYNLILSVDSPSLDHRAYVWYMKKFLRKNLLDFIKLKEIPLKIKLWFIVSAFFPKFIYRVIQKKVENR